MKLPIILAAVIALLSFSPPDAISEEGEKQPETHTFLGVSTFHLPPPLREHLEIEDGFGIQIHEVVADSPAEKAGLEENDILLKFKDQALISPEHLSLLVRRESEASVIPLTLIRKGAEKRMEVTLGEIERNNPHIRPRPDSYRMSPEQWQEHLKNQQDYWEKWMKKREPSRDGVGPGPERRRDREEPKGRPPAVSLNPGFPVRVFGIDGVIKIDNEQGEVSITHRDEGHRIVIKDADGNEIHAGPYDADLGVEGLPEEARDHLETMKLDNLKILAPRTVEEAPEKTSSPMSPPSVAPDEDLL